MEKLDIKYVISNELKILERRLLLQFSYGWKPYNGKIYYKLNEWDVLSGTVIFMTKQPETPSKFEILMKFETDFPGYTLLNIRKSYIPGSSQMIYITHVYNIKGVWVKADEINKLFINHPDYELYNGL